jgi:hypothetical protein
LVLIGFAGLVGLVVALLTWAVFWNAGRNLSQGSDFANGAMVMFGIPMLEAGSFVGLVAITLVQRGPRSSVAAAAAAAWGWNMVNLILLVFFVHLY